LMLRWHCSIDCPSWNPPNALVCFASALSAVRSTHHKHWNGKSDPWLNSSRPMGTNDWRNVRPSCIGQPGT